MKIYEATIVLIGILVLMAVAGYVSIHFLGPENPVEEIAEEVIESQTGWEIDLSSESEEVHKG